jgi:hypothetical protein
MENGMTLEQLCVKEKMSVRAKNVCIMQNWRTLDAILNHMDTYCTFEEVRQCGVKTQQELLAICVKYAGDQERLVKWGLGSGDSEAFKLENPFEYELLRNHIQFLLSTLDTVTKRAYQQFLDEPNDVIKFVDRLQRLKLRTPHPKLTRKRGYARFVVFCDHVLSFSELLKSRTPKTFPFEYFKHIWHVYQDPLPANENEMLQQIVDAQGKIKLFNYIALLTGTIRFFNKNEKIIFRYLFTNEVKSDKECSKDCGVTKTRFQQLVSVMEFRLPTYFSFLKNVEPDVFSYPGLDFGKGAVLINNAYANGLSSSEGLSFTAEFYAIILNILHPDRHFLIGYHHLKPIKWEKDRKMNRFYLIKNSIYGRFNFVAFRDDIYKLAGRRSSKEWSRVFESYLQAYMYDSKEKVPEDVYGLCEDLLYEEVGVKPDLGILTFQGNVREPLSEKVVAVFSELGQLSDFGTVMSALKSKFPEFTVNEQTLLSLLRRDKSKFILVSRSGLYGLKAWEGKLPGCKGGTMRSIAMEYLKSRQPPVPLQDVFDYVSNYRNTTYRSFRENIRINKEDFIFLEKDFVMLKNNPGGDTNTGLELLESDDRDKESKEGQ